MTLENKALRSKSPELPIIRLSKSHVKSNSFGTTKFFVVNGSIVDDPNTICGRFSQHFSQCYNTETKTYATKFPMLTPKHLSKFGLTFTNIKQAIAALKK